MDANGLGIAAVRVLKALSYKFTLHPALRQCHVCALNGEYKSLFNGKDTRRVKVSYARGNVRSISKSQGGLK